MDETTADMSTETCLRCGEEKPLDRFRGGDCWHSLTCARCEGLDPEKLELWEDWFRDEEPMEEDGDQVVADVLAGAAARIRELEARVERVAEIAGKQPNHRTAEEKALMERARNETGASTLLILTLVVTVGALSTLVVGPDGFWARLGLALATVVGGSGAFVLWLFEAISQR